MTIPHHQPNGTEKDNVLGVCWNNQSDQQVFQRSTFGEAGVILVPISLIGSFYDPFTPVVRFKVLIQELCRSQVYWDKLLEGETLKKWKDLAKDLIKPVAINWSHIVNQSSHFHPLNSAMHLPLHMQQSHTWLR